MRAMGLRIAGSGAHLPAKVVHNDQLASIMDTSDEWIRVRTGIRQRYQVEAGEYTSDLAIAAARQALVNANLEAADIDGIICATATPDYTFPGVASMVQAALGAKTGPCYDLQAVCAGFLYSLVQAAAWLKAEGSERILIVGAETISRLLNYEDRSTAVLFGDGAGAVVLERVDDPEVGLLAASLHMDGGHIQELQCSGGVSRTGESGKITMNGRAVYQLAVERVPQSIEACLDEAGISAQDIDWFVPHQANRRIMDSIVKRFDLSPDSLVATVDQHANTSAASIPLAFHHAVEDGRIQAGQTILFAAMGGGFGWGAAIFRL